MRRIILVFILTCVYCHFSQAQENYKFSGGFGIGLDYGGLIGTKITYLPAKWVGLFGSVGLYYYETGYNFGALLKIPTGKRLTPYLTGMYGTNAEMESKVYITRHIYTGATIGDGLELNSRKNDRVYFNFELLYPFRVDQFDDDIEKLKSQGLTVESTSSPVTVSFGIHLKLGVDYTN